MREFSLTRMPYRLWMALAIAALIVVSCATTTTPPGATQTPLTQLRIANGLETITLDPPAGGSLIDQIVSVQLFDSLLHRTQDGKTIPRLALKWENVNPTTWRFTLRTGVKFQNGEVFDAQAMKFSIERYKSPLSVQASRYTNIISVTVVDAQTVDINLKNPDPILPNAFIANAFMLPPKYYAENTPAFLAANPVGSGPYKLKEWIRGDHLTFEANPNYWQGKPSIPTVVFRTIPDASTRVAALQSGEIDIASEIPPAQISSVKGGSVADVKIVSGPRAVYIGLRANGPKPAPELADKRVRQALNYAVNRKAIVDSLLFGTATLLGQPIPPTYLGYDTSIQPYPYDPALAKKLLAEAGFPNGFSLEMDFTARYLTRDQAQVVQADLAAVGVKLTLNEKDQTAYINSIVAGGATPMYSLSIQGRTGLDAIEIFEVALVTNGSFNWNKYSNPAADKLIAEGAATLDAAARGQKFQQASQLIRDDPPWIFMWNNQSSWGVRKGVNWNPRGDDTVFVWDDVK